MVPLVVIISALCTAIFLILIAQLFFSIRRRRDMNAAIHRLLNQDGFDYLLLDTQCPEAYEHGHIPGAFNVPIDEASDCFPTENMFENIYVYGKSRRDSRRVARALSVGGYFNVTDFGSLRRWKGDLDQGPGSHWTIALSRKENT